MDTIDAILKKLDKMLISLGFKEVSVSGSTNFVLGNSYRRPQYVEGLGFLMEYAPTREEAEKNWHCDGDSFPLHMGEAAILEGIKAEVIACTPELRQESSTFARVV